MNIKKDKIRKAVEKAVWHSVTNGVCHNVESPVWHSMRHSQNDDYVWNSVRRPVANSVFTIKVSIEGSVVKY